MAAQEALSQFIIFFDDDVVPRMNCVSEYAKAMLDPRNSEVQLGLMPNICNRSEEVHVLLLHVLSLRKQSLILHGSGAWICRPLLSTQGRGKIPNKEEDACSCHAYGRYGPVHSLVSCRTVCITLDNLYLCLLLFSKKVRPVSKE